MHADLAAALAPQEETVEFAGRKLRVHELDLAADMPATEGRKLLDFAVELLVLCVKDADGAPAFTSEDVPVLKRAGRRSARPLIDAAFRVNGLDVKAEVKNSAADQGSG